MIASLPNELFNSKGVPLTGQTTVRVSDAASAIVLRIPNCSQVMAERMLWNTVCDIAERVGALREKKSGTLDAEKSMTLTEPTYGAFLRFTGAGVSGAKAGVDTLTFTETATYPKVTFSGGTIGASAYVEYSVVPDLNAVHDVTPSTSGGTTTYPNDKWIAPSWFMSAYKNVILAGALFRLHGMTARPWTDFNAARSQALIYNRELNRISHGLITSGMRRQAMTGEEAAFIGNAQPTQTVPAAQAAQ